VHSDNTQVDDTLTVNGVQYGYYSRHGLAMALYTVEVPSQRHNLICKCGCHIRDLNLELVKTLRESVIQKLLKR
jgi:hypothetical protein